MLEEGGKGACVPRVQPALDFPSLLLVRSRLCSGLRIVSLLNTAYSPSPALSLSLSLSLPLLHRALDR